MRRPTGITLLALLLLGCGITMALLAMALVANPEIGASLRSSHLHNGFPGSRAGAGIVLFWTTVSSIYLIVVGTGLWFMSSAARWALLLCTGLPLGRSIVGLVIILFVHPQLLSKIGDGFWFRSIFLAAILLYLVRPDIQRAFDVPAEHFDGVYFENSTSQDSESANRDYSGRR
jgi:hypothetical protein